METFLALLAICAGNSLVISEFPSQRPVTQSFDVFLDLRLNKRLRKNCKAGDLGRHRHCNVDYAQRLRQRCNLTAMLAMELHFFCYHSSTCIH